MPVTPPDPGRILDTLRATLGQLRELAALYPADPRLMSAMPGVEQAINAMATPSPQKKP
jgi:hypothetical protein